MFDLFAPTNPPPQICLPRHPTPFSFLISLHIIILQLKKKISPPLTPFQQFKIKEDTEISGFLALINFSPPCYKQSAKKKKTHQIRGGEETKKREIRETVYQINLKRKIKKGLAILQSFFFSFLFSPTNSQSNPSKRLPLRPQYHRSTTHIIHSPNPRLLIHEVTWRIIPFRRCRCQCC